MRSLNLPTLKRAAKHYAAHFSLPSTYSKKRPDVAIGGREWVLQNFYNLAYKDEFEVVLGEFKRRLGPDPLIEFEIEAKKRFTPRDDAVLKKELAERLAITPDGIHIPGKIGTVAVGNRVVGRRITRHGVKNAAWNIYAGEDEERALGNVREVGKDGRTGAADPLPPPDTLFPGELDHMGAIVMMALNTNVSYAFAAAGLDPALDLLDEGTADGVLIGRDGSQPADPDAAAVGTILFELDLGTPAFGAAADQAPHAMATATAIADDTSANATSTVTWCRGSSSNSVPTPLNDHIDGSAGLTSGTFDFEFNTDAIVTGATVSMTWTVTWPQGPTAS